jgi:hypothetical protein
MLLDSQYVVDSDIEKWVFGWEKTVLDRKMLIYGSACCL